MPSQGPLQITFTTRWMFRGSQLKLTEYQQGSEKKDQEKGDQVIVFKIIS